MELLNILINDPLIWTLLVLSFIGVALFLERLFTVSKAQKFEEKTYIEILRMIDQGQTSEAAKICKLSDGAICKIMEQGLSYADTDILLAQETIEQSAGQFIRSLEKNLNTLSTFAAVAPLIGFLGTVIGMIRVFFELQAAGQGVDISMLSGGIGQALFTTVGGLVVGILCLVFHNYIVSKIEAIAFLVEGKISQVNVHLRRIQK